VVRGGFWIVAGDEVVEVAALKRIFLEGEVFVRPEVVNPEPLCPRFSAAGLRSKKRTFALKLARRSKAEVSRVKVEPISARS
jgi:hypothetical protein